MSSSLTLLSSEDQSISMTIPEKQLLRGSFQVNSQKQFKDWTAENYAESYDFTQRITQTWQQNKVTDQYLIYGKIDQKPFHWEIVPYQKCRTLIGRIIQQLKVLWRTIFGGIKTSDLSRKEQFDKYHSQFSKWVTPPSSSPITSSPGMDAFCKKEVIDKQCVFEGDRVNVLFNYAPIGLGGEKLHFLIVPKQHRKTFNDLTREEYTETLLTTKKLIQTLKKTRKIYNVHFMLKVGKDAGLTVDHSHLHVIISQKKSQNFWGRLTVFKNILFGSSPMKGKALEETVQRLSNELKSF